MDDVLVDLVAGRRSTAAFSSNPTAWSSFNMPSVVKGLNFGLFQGRIVATAGCSSTDSDMNPIQTFEVIDGTLEKQASTLLFGDCGAQLVATSALLCSINPAAGLLQCHQGHSGATWMNLNSRLPQDVLGQPSVVFTKSDKVTIASLSASDEVYTLCTWQMDADSTVFAMYSQTILQMPGVCKNAAAVLRAVSSVGDIMYAFLGTCICNVAEGSCFALPSLPSLSSEDGKLSWSDVQDAHVSTDVLVILLVTASDSVLVTLSMQLEISAMRSMSLGSEQTRRLLKGSLCFGPSTLPPPSTSVSLTTTQASTTATMRSTIKKTSSGMTSSTTTHAASRDQHNSTTSTTPLPVTTSTSMFSHSTNTAPPAASTPPSRRAVTMYLNLDYSTIDREKLNVAIQHAIKRIAPGAQSTDLILKRGSVIVTAMLEPADATLVEAALMPGLEIEYDGTIVIAYASAPTTIGPTASLTQPAKSTTSPTIAATTSGMMTSPSHTTLAGTTSTSTATIATMPTSAVATTQTSSTQTTPAQAQGSGSGGASTNAGAVGAGVAVGLLLIIVVAVLVWQRQRRAGGKSSKRAQFGGQAPFMLSNPMFSGAAATADSGGASNVKSGVHREGHGTSREERSLPPLGLHSDNSRHDGQAETDYERLWEQPTYVTAAPVVTSGDTVMSAPPSMNSTLARDDAPLDGIPAPAEYNTLRRPPATPRLGWGEENGAEARYSSFGATSSQDDYADPNAGSPHVAAGGNVYARLARDSSGSSGQAPPPLQPRLSAQDKTSSALTENAAYLAYTPDTAAAAVRGIPDGLQEGASGIELTATNLQSEKTLSSNPGYIHASPAGGHQAAGESVPWRNSATFA